MKRLLVLAPAPASAAATRFRLVQYFDHLRAAGVEPCLRPFLDERGFSLLYESGQSTAKAQAALRAMVGRIVDLVRASRADGVLIHREAALVGPPVLEWLIGRPLGLPVLFDLDDAVWVPYSSPTYGPLLSRLLKWPEKTRYTLSAAKRIIVGNEHLARFARSYSNQVDVIPTIVDTDVFRPAYDRQTEVPVLGWIGTHSSAQYLALIVPALQELARHRRFVVRVIGGSIDAPGVEVETRPWSLAREVEDFQSLDVGLYPLADDEWARGKSGFKAVQYMACGIPLVASPVGVTTGMLRDGENGFLATTHEEWIDRLGRLLDDSTLRRRMGEAGRTDAVARWSLEHHAPRFTKIVRDALD